MINDKLNNGMVKLKIAKRVSYVNFHIKYM
jgi:hypothetical protein